MKTPNLPKTIKPFDVVGAVKRALKKEDTEDTSPTSSAAQALQRMKRLFVFNSWAAGFGYEPKSVSGEFYWTPKSDASPFNHYADILPSVCECVAWNLRHPSSEQCNKMVDFYGKFCVVYKLYSMLAELTQKSELPEYKGVPIRIKAISYTFCGDVMQDSPKEYKIQFDIGGDHYLANISPDYKQIMLDHDNTTDTIPSVDFKAELDKIIAEHDRTEFVDLASI